MNWVLVLNIELFWYLTVCKENLYLYQTELFEIVLIICIKMDLALNNLWRLIDMPWLNQPTVQTLMSCLHFT